MDRRKFIKKSGIATAGVLTTSPVLNAFTNTINFNSNVNLGVIGTGARGKGIIKMLNSVKGINVIACSDVLPFRLEKGIGASKTPAKGYANYKSLLDDKNVVAVIVSTPFNTHSKIAIDALDAGKHVYCEKTLAKGYAGIAALENKVKQSSKIVQTGHQYHSSRLYKHVVELIKGGEIGKIISFQCQWNRNRDWRRKVSDPSLERQINWRMYREYSGGLVAELCSHQIDFVNWVLDENPKKIVGLGGVDYWKDGRETYDNIHLIYEYPSGVKATFRCLTANSNEDYQIKIHGDKGTIYLGFKDAWISYEKDYQKELGEVDGVSGATSNITMQSRGVKIHLPHTAPTKQALIDFKDAILDNKTPLSNINSGANTARAVQLSLDAMYSGDVKYWKDI